MALIYSPAKYIVALQIASVQTCVPATYSILILISIAQIWGHERASGAYSRGPFRAVDPGEVWHRYPPETYSAITESTLEMWQFVMELLTVVLLRRRLFPRAGGAILPVPQW
jgi:hypothetical protein